MEDLLNPPTKFTVLSSEKSYPTSSSTNAYNASQSIANLTLRVRYRESLWRWLKKINGVAKYDEKMKGIRETVGHSIIESCDTLAQDRLLEA